MTTCLKKAVVAINVENNIFIADKDRYGAEDICNKYNLQTILETVSEYFKDGKFLPGYDKYLTVSKALIHNARDNWIVEFLQGFIDQTTESVCITCLKSLSSMAWVAPYTGEDKEFIPDDFKDVPYRGYLVMSCLYQLVKKLIQFQDINNDVEVFNCAVNVSYFSVMLIALHHDNNLWTSSYSNTLSQSLLSDLMTYWSVENVCDLLVLNLHQGLDYNSADKKTSILGKLLQNWKPKLLRQTWKQNPTIASSFSWCLKNLKFPHTSEFLELVLPPCLLFADDYMGTNKILGVQCLIYIMETAGSEELRWYGRADVIYEALKFQMYRTEEELLRMTIQALLLVLKIVERNTDDLCSRTRYDDILAILLQNASHENKLSLRRVHTEYLHVFIESIGINSVKYLKQVIELADEYLEVSDAPKEVARINVLKAVISLIQVAWPRLQPSITQIIKILVKLVHQLHSQTVALDPDVKGNLIQLVHTIFSLLKAIDNDLVSQSLSSLKKLPFPDECLSFMNVVLE